jgi:ABC-type glycerol-3-phosphate transport system permease component
MANQDSGRQMGPSAQSRLGASLLRGATYLVLTAGAATMVLPLLWMLSTSVMTLGEANTGRLLPRAARLTCPHVNLTKTVEGGVVKFAVSPTVREGAQELHTESYYVEVQQDPQGQSWQFRLVNDAVEPIPIAPVGQPGGAFTEDWQSVPQGGGLVNTERGLSFTFASPPVLEEAGRRSGAARTDYVNCCEYPTWMLVKNEAERAGRTYTGPRMETDLSNCRTPGHQLSYVLVDLLFGNYRQAWVTAKFSEYIRNSVFLTSITIAGLLVVSTLAAYAFARMEFPGRELIFGLLLSTMMIPETVTMIPNFLTITGNNPFLPFIKWYDNWPALTIPFMAGFFNIFMLRQFFAQVPNELWDAAQIDGAGHLRFLARIVLPLSTAPLMTVIIFSFIGSWNALLWPLIATKAGSNWWPVSVGLQNFVTEAGPETHLWMAGASISMMPVLILYFVAQKQFIEGIATTGLKG